MYHGLPTTVEEYTVWTLSDYKLSDTLNLVGNKDVWEWLNKYGHLFLDRFEFIEETDMGHGERTHMVMFDGQLILILGGGMFVSTDLYFSDLPACFEQVPIRSVLI